MDITLAGGAVTYEPNDDQLGRTSLEFAAFDGEVGFGQLPVPDAAAGLTVAGGRQARVDEDTTLLSDGFIVDQDRARGPEPAGTAREYSFGVTDANALLDGFRVRVTRPSETDYARVIAMAAVDLPSADTTWVLNSDTVTMPKKRYDSDGGWTAELIPDLVEFTGKTLFLHDKAGGGRCLHYHVLTTGHTSGLTITDDGSVVNGINIFAPQSPIRNRTSVDLRNSIRGRDQAGRIYRADDSASITAHNADGLQHEALVDFETTGAADLRVKTTALLASQKDELDTYTLAIGPLDFAALAKIRVGDFIATTSSVLGLTASAQRIAHMTLTPYAPGGIPAPGLWNAALELARPIRRRARIKARKPPIILPPFVPECDDGDMIDNFNRANGAPGTATPSGFIWTTGVGDAVIDGNRLRVVATGGPTDLDLVSLPLPAGVTFEWEADGAPSPNPPFGLDNAYVYLQIGTNEIDIFYVDNYAAKLTISYTFSAGIVYKFRLALTEDTISLKVWELADPEPAAWNGVLTDPVGAATSHTTQFHLLGSSADWFIENLTQFGECATPLPGQFVPDVEFIGDGVTTAFLTQFAYVGNSLGLIVNGLDWSAYLTETDPTTGAYDLTYAPPLGATVRPTYQANP